MIWTALAVWRLTYMLTNEIGPDRFLEKFRLRFMSQTLVPVEKDGKITYRKGYVGTGLIGQILECFYCCSVWVSVPFALYWSYRRPYKFPIYLFGLSGAAILTELVRRKLDE